MNSIIKNWYVVVIIFIFIFIFIGLRQYYPYSKRKIRRRFNDHLIAIISFIATIISTVLTCCGSYDFIISFCESELVRASEIGYTPMAFIFIFSAIGFVYYSAYFIIAKTVGRFKYEQLRKQQPQQPKNP